MRRTESPFIPRFRTGVLLVLAWTAAFETSACASTTHATRRGPAAFVEERAPTRLEEAREEEPDDVPDALVEEDNARIEATPAAAATGDEMDGRVSYYSDRFRGRRTANGERYDPRRLTAASRTLPFDTVVRVTVGERSVVVRVNDRGPFRDETRLLDLSRAAAQRLDIVRRGVADAHIEIVQLGDGRTHHRRRRR